MLSFPRNSSLFLETEISLPFLDHMIMRLPRNFVSLVRGKVGDLTTEFGPMEGVFPVSSQFSVSDPNEVPSNLSLRRWKQFLFWKLSFSGTKLWTMCVLRIF